MPKKQPIKEPLFIFKDHKITFITFVIIMAFIFTRSLAILASIGYMKKYIDRIRHGNNYFVFYENKIVQFREGLPILVVGSISHCLKNNDMKDNDSQKSSDEGI